MKELKNRIKGLSAILLAVSLTLCLVVRFLGIQASASDYSINLFDKEGNLKNSDGTDIFTTYENCINDKIQFSDGTGWEIYSGGYFTINSSDTDSAIIGCITPEKSYSGSKSDTSSSGTITCYGKATINNLPSNCDYVIITACRPLDDYTYNYNTIYSLTVKGVYNTTTIQTGIYTDLTTGTPYSFPNTGSIHKVEGDPTDYYATNFCVSSSGRYKILQ